MAETHFGFLLHLQLLFLLIDLHCFSFVFAIVSFVYESLYLQSSFFGKSIETNLMLQLAFWRRLFALVANLLLIKELDLDKLDFLSSYNSYHTIHMIAHRGAFFA